MTAAITVAAPPITATTIAVLTFLEGMLVAIVRSQAESEPSPGSLLGRGVLRSAFHACWDSDAVAIIRDVTRLIKLRVLRTRLSAHMRDSHAHVRLHMRAAWRRGPRSTTEAIAAANHPRHLPRVEPSCDHAHNAQEVHMAKMTKRVLLISE